MLSWWYTSISFIDDKLGIKTTKYHNEFNLKKDKNNNIIQGKKDLFAIMHLPNDFEKLKDL